MPDQPETAAPRAAATGQRLARDFPVRAGRMRPARSIWHLILRCLAASLALCAWHRSPALGAEEPTEIVLGMCMHTEKDADACVRKLRGELGDDSAKELVRAIVAMAGGPEDADGFRRALLSLLSCRSMLEWAPQEAAEGALAIEEQLARAEPTRDNDGVPHAPERERFALSVENCWSEISGRPLALSDWLFDVRRRRKVMEGRRKWLEEVKGNNQREWLLANTLAEGPELRLQSARRLLERYGDPRAIEVLIDLSGVPDAMDDLGMMRVGDTANWFLERWTGFTQENRASADDMAACWQSMEIAKNGIPEGPVAARMQWWRAWFTQHGKRLAGGQYFESGFAVETRRYLADEAEASCRKALEAWRKTRGDAEDRNVRRALDNYGHVCGAYLAALDTVATEADAGKEAFGKRMIDSAKRLVAVYQEYGPVPDAVAIISGYYAGRGFQLTGDEKAACEQGYDKVPRNAPQGLREWLDRDSSPSPVGWLERDSAEYRMWLQAPCQKARILLASAGKAEEYDRVLGILDNDYLGQAQEAHDQVAEASARMIRAECYLRSARLPQAKAELDDGRLQECIEGAGWWKGRELKEELKRVRALME